MNFIRQFHSKNAPNRLPQTKTDFNAQSPRKLRLQVDSVTRRQLNASNTLDTTTYHSRCTISKHHHSTNESAPAMMRRRRREAGERSLPRVSLAQAGGGKAAPRALDQEERRKRRPSFRRERPPFFVCVCESGGAHQGGARAPTNRCV